MIPEGTAILKEYEKGPDLRGPALVAYQCPAGVWTIGWGHTLGVRQNQTITLDQAESLLFQDVSRCEAQVRSVCTVPPNAYQLAAMVLLVFNIGFEEFRQHATVLKCHNRGDVIGASRAFGLYNKATVNGKLTVERGLVSRRAQEAALYMRAETAQARTLMPQTVASEPSVAKSAPVAGSAIAGGLGAAATAITTVQQSTPVGTLQAVSDHVQTFAGIAWSVQPLIDMLRYTPAVFGLLAAGVLGYVAWRAYQRRRQGHL